MILATAHVGSRVTCNPPPTDTDDDWLYFVTDITEFVNEALADGFYIDGSLMGGEVNLSQLPGGLFVSLKKRQDVRNLIVTSDHTFYERFLAATHVCRRLNLQDKTDRIALFQAVLYGERYD